MEISIFRTVQELTEAVARFFINSAQGAISLRGEFNVALSGGNSPQLLYSMLASPDFRYQVNWDKVNFFFADERYVPFNDEQNNGFMVKRLLFEPLNISASNIFPINTNLSPHEAAKEYTDTIASHFKEQKPRFDLILLGLGDNSHTASLFPYTSVLSNKSASVKAIFLKQQNQYRITMTAPMINQAHHIAFLVYGQVKAEAVHNVLEKELNTAKYPAQLIHPEQGDLHWYLDETAASRLNRNGRSPDKN